MPDYAPTPYATPLLTLHLAVTPTHWPAVLTEAERHIVMMCARGLSTQAMAEIRGVQPRTVSNQLSQLYRKLGVFDRHAMLATVFALSPPSQGGAR